MVILAKLQNFVKIYQNEFVLAVGVFLVCLLSFAAGYIAAREHLKTPLYIEEPENIQ